MAPANLSDPKFIHTLITDKEINEEDGEAEFFFELYE